MTRCAPRRTREKDPLGALSNLAGGRFLATRVRAGVVDRYVGTYEHQLLPGGTEDMPWLIGRRRVLINHSIESAGGQVSILL